MKIKFKNNIILVDGASTAGKTTFSKYIAKKLRYKYISFDDVWFKIQDKYPKKDMNTIDKLVCKSIKSQLKIKTVVDNPMRGYRGANVKTVLVHSKLPILVKNFIKRAKSHHPSNPRTVFNGYHNIYKISNKAHSIEKINKKDIYNAIKSVLNAVKNNPKRTKRYKKHFSEIEKTIHRLPDMFYITPRHRCDFIALSKLKGWNIKKFSVKNFSV